MVGIPMKSRMPKGIADGRAHRLRGKGKEEREQRGITFLWKKGAKRKDLPE
jgi:hypothetical protein